MKNSLSLKFSISIGILAFLVANMVGFYSNSIMKEQLEINSGNSLVKLSKRVNDILDREMLERYREIRFAASQAVMTNENSSIQDKKDFIQSIKDNYNHHEWIGYALPDGTVQIGTNGYLEGKSVKARPWHPEGLKGPYIGDVHDALLLAKLLPNNSGEAIYFSDVAFPVKNEDNKTLGVLCTHLSWQWTRNIIRNIQKENNVDIFLLSSSGLILVGPNDTERSEFSKVFPSVDKAFASNQELYKVLSWTNEGKYLTASSVSSGFEEYKGFSWKVVVRQHVDEAFKVSQKNSSMIFVMSLFAGFIGALIGILISNKISRPLEELSLLVDNLRENKEVDFMKNVSNDEIGNLHNAIKNLYNSFNDETKLKEDAQNKVDLALKIFEQTLEGILITDKHNNIILVNKAFTDITGFEMSDVYGKNPSILSAIPKNKKIYEEMWNSINSIGKWDGKIQNRRKDGTIYEEYLRISSLKDENGKIINYLATFNSNF